MKQDNGETQLTLHAIPVSSELAAIDVAAVELPCDTEWRQPPSIGPPAEIRFAALENNS